MKTAILSPLSTGLLLTALAMLLSSCILGGGVRVDCPQITAPRETASMFMSMEDSQEVFDVRFNGVQAECKTRRNGDIVVDLAIGLKIKRALQPAPGGTAEIHLLSVVLDRDDRPVDTQPFSYKIGFVQDEHLKYPVANHQVLMLPGERVVISLLPTP